MDLQEVLKLLDLMEKHALDEIEVEQGGVRVRLKKAPPPQAVMAHVMAPPPPHLIAPAPVHAAAAAPAPVEDKDLVKIISPMVGTFYRAPSPDAEMFANEGDKVTSEQVVCIIEAMKVMNEIKSEMDGEIVNVLVENGESVEYGQPLFTIRRTGVK